MIRNCVLLACSSGPQNRGIDFMFWVFNCWCIWFRLRYWILEWRAAEKKENFNNVGNRSSTPLVVRVGETRKK